MGRATTTATKELSLDGYDMGKIKEFVKQHAGVLAVRQQSRAVERLLRLEPGAIFGMPESGDVPAGGVTPVAPKAPPPPTREVQEKQAIKYDDTGAPILDVDQGLSLQEELIEGFSDE